LGHHAAIIRAAIDAGVDMVAVCNARRAARDAQLAARPSVPGDLDADVPF
jgi:beta-glucosidase-like glycosyl hydrolase